MKASSRRPEQVAETLRQVITDALARDVRDPRVGFVTVTAVLVTNELSHARVMVSAPGDDAAKAKALEGLESAAGFLRSRAARAHAASWRRSRRRPRGAASAPSRGAPPRCY